MRALIIDDEKHCVETLQTLLEKYCPEVEIAGSCQDGECGLIAIRDMDPDLIFLDIAMPRMNGFDMLNRLDEIRFEIIFTTAFDHFAIRAFKVSAVDYLLKPVDRHELMDAVDRVREKIFLKVHADTAYNAKEQMHLLLRNLQETRQAFPNIAIPTMEGLEIIRPEEILYVLGEGNYSQIHIRGRKPLLVSKTIKYIEERVEGHRFFRIHNSALINLNEINRYIRGGAGQVRMSDGALLNVSRQRKDELLRILKQ